MEYFRPSLFSVLCIDAMERTQHSGHTPKKKWLAKEKTHISFAHWSVRDKKKESVSFESSENAVIYEQIHGMNEHLSSILCNHMMIE